MQVKILRATQEEEIRRLGEAATRKVDLRVVAATNKDLFEEVKAGRFREDLYYRLNVFQIFLPPLRERAEDIPLLAQHFLARISARHQLEPKKLSPEAMRALTEQTWSGNVRALQNVIEQAAIISEGTTITIRDLPFGPAPITEAGLLVSIPEERSDLKTVLKEVTEQTERIIIKRTLEKNEYNRTRAAQVLGISRRALINKIQTYGLD
jgi:two-component system response regulator AtoC